MPTCQAACFDEALYTSLGEERANTGSRPCEKQGDGDGRAEKQVRRAPRTRLGVTEGVTDFSGPGQSDMNDTLAVPCSLYYTCVQIAGQGGCAGLKALG